MKGKQEQTKRILDQKNKTKFIEHIEVSGKGNSKVRHLLDGKNRQMGPGNPAKYSYQLTRKQVSTISKARTRMLVPIFYAERAEKKQKPENMS